LKTKGLSPDARSNSTMAVQDNSSNHRVYFRVRGADFRVFFPCHSRSLKSKMPMPRIATTGSPMSMAFKGNPAFGHEVPLSTQAVEVLRAIRILSSHSPILFPGIRSWRVAMTDAALSSMYKKMAGGRSKNRIVPYGWRSSFSTIMNERAAEMARDSDRHDPGACISRYISLRIVI